MTLTTPPASGTPSNAPQAAGPLRADEGSAEFGPDWTICALDARAEDLLRPLSEPHGGLIGLPLWQALPGLLGSVCETRLRQAQAQGQPTSFEWYHAPRARWLALRAEPLDGGLHCRLRDLSAPRQDDHAQLIHAARLAADERNALLECERRARAEAERTSHMKDEFLATLSHELRTPLTAILGWAQILRCGTRDQADLLRGLQTIERNARTQVRLIEDLLDMSRIAAGTVPLEMLALSPAVIAAGAMALARPAADARQIRLEEHFEAAPGLVAGDAGRLQQIIGNLLSNALKFTPRGGCVRVSVARAGEQIAISVCDTGIGIAPEFLAHVFERFRQADASTTRKHGGLGLGLAIVKHLVEQHGGSVSASSAGEGRGACFTVRLPLAPPTLALAPVPPPDIKQPAQTLAPSGNNRQHGSAYGGQPPATHDLSGLQVLVVDDEDDARDLIKRILNDCNADVLTAATAGEALTLLQHARPDLMVSDLGMPEVDGFGLLDRIRAMGPARGGDLPAIALTAFARSEDRIKALAGGFLAHIAKPVEPAELVSKVAAMGAAHRHA